MAFIPINSAEVSAGEPTKQEIFTKTKDNFDDHEGRIISTEAAVLAFLPIDFGLNGFYGLVGSVDNYAGVYRVTFTLTVTAVRLHVKQVGSGGSTETDILFKRGAGAWTSILTTRASVAFGAGDDAISTNAVLDPSDKFLQAGDLLRADLTATMSGSPKGLTTFVEFEKT